MSDVVPVLQAARARLSGPRAWVKYHWSAYRDEHGIVHRLEANDKKSANCWCLGEAITLAVYDNMAPRGTMRAVADLRSDAERELLTTLERMGDVDPVTGRPFPAVYLWQDRPTVSHADVVGLLDATLARLLDVTRDPALEALYTEVEALAEADAKAGIAGRQLDPRLADLQSEYEEYFRMASAALATN